MNAPVLLTIGRFHEGGSLVLSAPVNKVLQRAAYRRLVKAKLK